MTGGTDTSKRKVRFKASEVGTRRGKRWPCAMPAQPQLMLAHDDEERRLQNVAMRPDLSEACAPMLHQAASHLLVARDLSAACDLFEDDVSPLNGENTSLYSGMHSECCHHTASKSSPQAERIDRGLSGD